MYVQGLYFSYNSSIRCILIVDQCIIKTVHVYFVQLCPDSCFSYFRVLLCQVLLSTYTVGAERVTFTVPSIDSPL